MSGRGRVGASTGATQTGDGLLDRGGLAHIQRSRLLSAMTEVVCERGASDVSVAPVVERAGVSRRTFYELFADREDCFLAAFDDAVGRMAERVVPAYRRPGRWRERVRRALVELLRFLDEHPVTGRFAIVETLAGGRATLERRRRVLAPVIGAIHDGRNEAGAGGDQPVIVAEGVVGAVLAVLHNRLDDSEPPAMVELTGPLMRVIALPYLGPAAARRELERPVEMSAVPQNGQTRDPLKDLGMRLTYRTLRVLEAVAGDPGSSNRVVADASGIGDQGQISKLLGRLERLGLVQNRSTERVRGAPNMWALTDRGKAVHAALAAQR